MLRERAVHNLAPQPGTWQAGTQARTGLAACLGGFVLTAEQAGPSSAPLVLQAEQTHGTSVEASEVPASAAAVLGPQDAKNAGGSTGAAEVRMKRQPFLDSMRQGNQPGSNDSSRHRVESRLACSASSQLPSCATKEQELEEAKGKGVIAADHPGDQPGCIVPGSMQAGAAGTIDQNVASEQQRAAEQSSLEQRQAQAHGNGSVQQPLQECEICFQPMRFAYVSPSAKNFSVYVRCLRALSEKQGYPTPPPLGVVRACIASAIGATTLIGPPVHQYTRAEKCAANRVPLCVQLLPCGHSMCESCYGNTYPRGTKRLHCVFCRKAFAPSAAFRCPVALSQQLRRDDPKYAVVRRCLNRLRAHLAMALAQARACC